MRKIVLSIIGGAGVLLGLGWILQGLSLIPALIPPTRLAGHIGLVGNGAFLMAAAAMLIVWANRTPKRKAKPPGAPSP